MGSVRLDEATEKSLVEKLTKAVAEATQLNALEVHRQYARAEAELAQARLALSHKDQTIAGLEARVAQLSSIITTISQGGSPAFSPYNNNGPAPTGTLYPLPTYDGRVAAQAPVPAPLADLLATPVPPAGS